MVASCKLQVEKNSIFSSIHRTKSKHQESNNSDMYAQSTLHPIKMLYLGHKCLAHNSRKADEDKLQSTRCN